MYDKSKPSDWEVTQRLRAIYVYSKNKVPLAKDKMMDSIQKLSNPDITYDEVEVMVKTAFECDASWVEF